ncbi:SCY1-like protein [Dirofilaria immitis]
MTSREDALRRQFRELKEKIAYIEEEMVHLRKRRRAYIAKMKLIENHIDGYHTKGDIGNTDSSDESFSTTELLELSLSSVGSSVLYSDASLYSDQSDSGSNIESGKHGRFRCKRKQKVSKKQE